VEPVEMPEWERLRVLRAEAEYDSVKKDGLLDPR
jgi:hypothetical protein